MLNVANPLAFNVLGSSMSPATRKRALDEKSSCRLK
jgi:hypothetical protein